MDVRFYETGLRRLASGLAELTRPTPSALDHLAEQLNTIAAVAADAGRGVISRVAQDAHQAAQAMASDQVGARPTCIEAVKQLGQHLLGGLCAAVAEREPAPLPDRSQTRVLVVDDSRVATATLHHAFEARHHSVRTAVTLDEAFLELVLFAPRVLVSDIFMPDVEVELLGRAFRSLSRNRPNLLVLVSGGTGVTLLGKLKDIKPDVFVSKLDGASNVVDKVEAALSQYHAPSPAM